MTTLFCIHPKGFNIGNDAIHVGLRHMLDEAFGEVVNLVSIPATSRFESHARSGLTGKTIHEINQYADGVIVGGGNIYENGQLDLDTNALPTLEPPLMLFSMSYGRIYNRRSQLVPRTDAMPGAKIKALNDRADFSLARDHATYDHLRSLGCDRTLLGGCPTITLNEIESRLPPVPERDRDAVLLSVRTPSLMNIPLDAQARVHGHVERAIRTLREHGHENIRLLCHDHRDLPFAASFPDLDYVYTGDVYAYLALLRAAKLVVSYRLHATIPCLSFGTPVINLSYDERSLSAAHTLGFGEWSIDTMAGPDPVSELDDRLGRLGELEGVRTSMMNKHWRELRSVMASSLAGFRDAVRSYREPSTNTSNGETSPCATSAASM